VYIELADRITVYVIGIPVVSDIDKNSGDQDIVIFPSPSTGKLTIKFPVSINKFFLLISSIAGQIILEKVFEPKSGIETLDIDLTGFASGTYIIRFQTDEKTYLKKIMLQ